nr:hypothetical protein HK105_002417 [Polyrhizophydium stewartii]
MGDADFLPSDEDPASDEDNAIANDDSDDEGSCYGSDVRPRAPRMSLTSSAQSADSTMSGDSIVTAKPLRRGPRRAADPANYRFPCTLCDRAFTRKYNLEAHILVHQNRKPYSCSHKNCSEAFVRKYDLKRHIRTIHQRTYYGPCPHCQRQYSRIDSYRKHVRLCDLQHEEDSDA